MKNKNNIKYKRSSRELVEEARSNLPLPDLMEKLGYGEHAYQSALCPFHDDHNPSFSIYKYQGSWMWKCFACCISGDEIAFLEYAEDRDRTEAFKRYIELAGVSYTERGSH